MKKTPETEIIKIVALGLKDLLPNAVFVGGVTTCLYILDQNAPEPTPTDDVDLILEITSSLAYEQLENRLAKLGFKRDMIDPGLLCRFHFHSIKVDIMPIDSKILGFSNRWYPSGFKHAVEKKLDDVSVKIFDLPHFLASKLEAFIDRGQRGPLWESKDLEDIFTVLDAGEDPVKLIKKHPAIKEYLSAEFKRIMTDESRLLEAIESVLSPYGPGVRESRAKQVLGVIRKISEMK